MRRCGCAGSPESSFFAFVIILLSHGPAHFLLQASHRFCHDVAAEQLQNIEGEALYPSASVCIFIDTTKQRIKAFETSSRCISNILPTFDGKICLFHLWLRSSVSNHDEFYSLRDGLDQCRVLKLLLHWIIYFLQKGIHLHVCIETVGKYDTRPFESGPADVVFRV